MSLRIFLFILVCFNSAFFNFGKEIIISIKEEKINFDENDENYIFYFPTSLRIDKEGSIYVVDSRNSRIQVFSSNGKFIRTIGRKGQGPAEFFYPQDIFIRESVLYVSDTENRRIQIITSDGKFQKSIKLNFRPWNILVNKKNEIIVSKLVDVLDPSNEFLIKIISSKGEIISEFHKSIKTNNRVVNDLLNFILVTIDSKDNIIVAHKFLKNRIIKYDKSGKLLFEFKTLFEHKGPFLKVPNSNYEMTAYTQCITCGANDDIYLLSFNFDKNKKDFLIGNKIHIFDLSGKYRATLLLPFNAKKIAIDNEKKAIFSIDEEDRLRKCSLQNY